MRADLPLAAGCRDGAACVGKVRERLTECNRGAIRTMRPRYHYGAAKLTQRV